MARLSSCGSGPIHRIGFNHTRPNAHGGLKFAPGVPTLFRWLRRKGSSVSTGDLIVAQSPGSVFPWPRGAVLTAVDEVVFGLPVALFDEARPMSEFVFGPDNMEISVPPGSETFFIRLMPGMAVSLAKSCESYVVAEDAKPRWIKVTKPPVASE